MQSATLPPVALPAIQVPHGAPGSSIRCGRRRIRWYHVILGLGAAGLASLLLLVGAVVMSLRVDDQTRTLRQAAMEAAPGTWNREIEIGIGRLPVLLAKAGLAFVNLEPEARAGLSAFQSAQVGVYRRSQPAPVGDDADVLGHVTASMARRGWDPLVLVRDHSETVAVFLPRESRGNSLQVAVLVLDGDQLVVVSARADPEPLVDLALRHSSSARFLTTR